MAGKLAYNVDETVEQLGLSRDLLYDLMSGGKIRCVKAGRRRIIPADAIRDFLKGQPA